MSAKDFASTVVSWVTSLGIIIGGYYSFKEYKANLKNQKIERVFSYIDQFRKKPVYSSRLKVHVIWAEAEKGWISFSVKLAAKNEKEKLTGGQIQEEVDKFTYNLIQERMGWEVQLLSKFFDEIAICVNTKLCDRKTAYDFFGQELVSFVNLHQNYLISLRENYDPKFAEDLFKFKNAYMKANPIPENFGQVQKT